ncbi:hypothetical protein K438DRAFT_1939185 [Mycena galopus ATCC 62051]|nr:hypothetical protein K438DRAFT_1939185 [Mycena galopus ATCC 62051]
MLFFRLAILGLSLGAVLAFPDPTAEEPQTPDLAGALEIFPLDFIDRAPFLSMLNESEIPVYNGSTPFTSHLLFNIILSPFMLPLWWMSPWTGTGIPTRNSDQYCWYPHNPDIAGIGVRLAVYIQSVIVVILSLASRVRQRSPPDSLSGIYRIQVYTILAFVIAGAAQRAMGQLSIFHETVVVHLSFVSISSAWIGVPAAAEESRERWLGPGLSEHPRLSYLVRLLHLDNTSGLRLSIQSFLRRGGDLGPDWWGMAFMIPVVVVVAHDINQHVETCFPDAVDDSRKKLKTSLTLSYHLRSLKEQLAFPKGTQEIQVRSSSSSLCYLLAFCVLARPTHPRTRYTFISRDHPMKKSHVSPLIDALRENGSTITYSETSAGGYTLEVVPASRRGGDFKLDPTTPGTPAAALLMCAPRALVEVRLRLVGTGPMSSQRWIDLTLKRMKALGVLATRQDSLTANGQLLNSYAIPRTWYRFSGGFTKIASDDVSLANCCFALSAISGTTCEIKSLLLEQPDADFIFDVLPKFGCRVSRNEMIRKRTVIIGPAVGTLRPPGDLDMLKMPKSFLLAVMLAAVSYDPQRPHASTRITGITKQKGQDRIRIAARELEKFGVHCKDCTEWIFPTWWRTIKDDFGLQIGGVAPRANTVTTATPEPLSSIIITGKPFVRRVGGIAAAALLWEFIDATEKLENPLGTAVFENFVRGNPRRQIIYVGEDAAQADTSAAETLRAYTSRQGHLVHVSDQHSPLQAPTSWLRDCTPSFQLMISPTDNSDDNTELLAVSHEIRRFFKRIVHPAAPIDLSPKHPTYVLHLAQPDITPALLLLKSVSADAIELRVDVLEETPSSGEIPELAYVAEQLCALRQYSTLPVIFSLRSISHGGKHPDADVDAAFERFAFAIAANISRSILSGLEIASSSLSAMHMHPIPYGARDLYSACAAFGDVVRISSEARHAESNFALRAFLKAVPVQGSGVPLAAMTTGPYAQLSCVFNAVLTPVGLPGSDVAAIAETQRMRKVYNPTPTRSGKTFFLVQDQEMSIQRACLEVAYSQQGLATTCSIIQDIAELPNIIPQPDFAGFCVNFPTDLEAPRALLDKEAPNVSRTQYADLVIPDPRGALHGTNALCLGLLALLLRRTIISTTSRALVLGTNASVIYALCELGVGAIYICQGDRLVQTGILNNLPAEWQARVTLLDDLEELPAEEFPTAVSLVVATVRASVSATPGSRSGMSVPKGMVCSAHNGCIVDLDPDSHFIRSATAAGCSWTTVSLDEVLFERGIRVAELTAGRSFARDRVLERLKEDYPMLLVN